MTDHCYHVDIILEIYCEINDENLLEPYVTPSRENRVARYRWKT